MPEALSGLYSDLAPLGLYALGQDSLIDCELLAYGLLAGLLYQLLPKKYGWIYLSLAGAMLGGRVVWGLARTVMTLLDGTAFTFKEFLAAGFVQAIPGIILHIAIIPPIIYALRKAHVIADE